MGWFDSNNNNNETNAYKLWVEEPKETIRDQLKNYVNLDRIEKTIVQDPYVLTALGCTFAASFLVGFKLGRSPIGSRWSRLTSMSDVPSSYVGVDAPLLRGRVVSVSDGDTVRFLHVPTRLFHSSTLDKKNKKMSEVALPIRICTIDTPETAKFGKPGQAFGDDAKNYMASMVDQKMVNIRLLTKDQYGRGVAELRTGSWPFHKYADESMLQAGLAEVYLGSGAVYGHKGKEAYLEMEAEAKRNGKGIWSDKSRESAAEYKARMKAEA